MGSRFLGIETAHAGFVLMRCGAVLIFALGGCSAEDGSDDGLAPSYAGAGAAGASGAAAGTDGFAGSAGEPFVTEASGAGGGAASRPPDAALPDACASISREAKQVEVEVPVEVEVEVVEAEPIALFLMLDQSSSMRQTSLGVTSTKWQEATGALNTFVNDEASANLNIALQYFPLANGDCATGAGYDTPEVAMGLLPDHAANITASLALHQPGQIEQGRTPIEGALRGVTSYCARYKQDTTLNPEGEDCVAVLITDGLPTICSQDWAVLTDIAAQAYLNDQVMTFTIGMLGADFALLDMIAQAGHGDCTPDPADPSWACNVSTGGTTFIDALNLIRNMVTKLETRTETRTELEIQSLECEWEIPAPPPDQSFDKNKVNVEFTLTGLDEDIQRFGRVDSAAECGSQLGWYYDNPDNPTRIIACERTCLTIQTSAVGKINILLGCQTLVL